jgi:hypothetical protein
MRCHDPKGNRAPKPRLLPARAVWPVRWWSFLFAGFSLYTALEA